MREFSTAMWCHGRGCARPTLRTGLRPATTMERFSSRKTAIRRTTRSVCFFALVICPEMVGLLSPQCIGAGLEDVLLGFFFLMDTDRLRALLHNRYLRRGRCRPAMRRQWRDVVLDALPDAQWRRFTRVLRHAGGVAGAPPPAPTSPGASPHLLGYYYEGGAVRDGALRERCH